MYWSRSYFNRMIDVVGRSFDRSDVVVPTPKLLGGEGGGYLIFGELNQVLHPLMRRPRQIVVARTDLAGNPEWVRRWPDPAFDAVFGTLGCELERGDLIAAGSHWRNIGKPASHPRGIEVVLACFDHAGYMLWQQRLAKHDAHLSLCSLTSYDNVVIVVAQLTPKAIPDFDNKQGWIGALNTADGSVLWQITFDYGLPTTPSSIRRSADSEYTVIGDIAPERHESEPVIFARKIAGDGSLLDERTFVIAGQQSSTTALATVAEDTTHVIAGTVSPLGASSKYLYPPSSPFAIAFDFSGNKLTQWAKEYVLWPHDNRQLRVAFGSSASRTTTGDTILAGSCATGFASSYLPVGLSAPNPTYSLLTDAALLRLRDDGNVEWVRRYGGDEIDNFRSVQTRGLGPEQEIVVCGTTESFPAQSAIPNCLSNQRLWTMRLDSDGHFEGDMSCMYRTVGCEVNDLQVTSPRLKSTDEEGDVTALPLDREFKELDLNVVELSPPRSGPTR